MNTIPSTDARYSSTAPSSSLLYVHLMVGDRLAERDRALGRSTASDVMTFAPSDSS
jgi:hypothetical protein